MFSWICPQCGREVPPSYTECPDCAERAQQAAAAQPPAPPQQPPQPQQPVYQPVPPMAPPQQQYYAPPQQYAPVPPPPPTQQYVPPPPPTQQYAPPPPPPTQQYAPPPPQQYAPPVQQHYAPPPLPTYQDHPPHKGMNLPIWAMTILFSLAIGGVVGGLYWLFNTKSGSAGTGPAPSAAVESPAAKPGTKSNPIQKYIEVSGVRFVQDPKKKTTMAKFVIVNHSDSDINGLAGNVTIWGRTQKSEEDAQGTFSFSTNLGPMETQELTVPFKTKLKIYELPDWQNITTDVQITAPAE